MMASNVTDQTACRSQALKIAIGALKSSLMRTDARRLGIRLGLTDADLNSLEHDYPRDLREQIYQMFEMWKKKLAKKASVATLLIALKDESLNNMAEYIEQLVVSGKKCREETLIRTIDTYEDVVHVTDKMKVEVPRNAVPEVVNITFRTEQLDVRKLCLGPCEPVMPECLELGPDGYKFLKPLTFSYKLTKVLLEMRDVDILALTCPGNGTGPWTKLKTWKEGSDIKVEVNHFSYLAIVSQQKGVSIKKLFQKTTAKQLTKEGEQKLKTVVNKVSPELRSRDWRPVARALGFSDADIDAIEKDYPNDFKKQKEEMFHKWRSRDKEMAMAETLIKVLRQEGICDLAEEAEKEITVTKPDTKQKKSIFKSSSVSIGM